MRHGFHNAVIGVEGMFYKFFAVARNGSGKYFAVGVFFVKFGQVIAHGDNGVAFVALVKRIKQLAVRRNYGNFYGCAAAVYAEIGFPGGCNIAALNIVAVVWRLASAACIFSASVVRSTVCSAQKAQPIAT